MTHLQQSFCALAVSVLVGSLESGCSLSPASSANKISYSVPNDQGVNAPAGTINIDPTFPSSTIH